MDHVNGHQHFHMHPVVASAIARIAARALRSIFPSEPRSRPRALGELGLLFCANTSSAPTIGRCTPSVQRSSVRSE
jgi:hypothetical protein